ncbi:MAG: primase C-terminal domain-containing protein [Betaproteobacteria bacterium]|nr:primase C-terminal domain-containing protein [Betaproteobacteria bacterium]
MELAEFYSLLLPREGFTCLFEKATKRHVWSDDLTDLEARTRQCAFASADWYFGVGSFTEQRRRQVNVLQKKSLYLDIDAGEDKHSKNPEETYPTANAALTALQNFVASTGLAPTVIASSGAGLHVYWALDVPVSEPVWKKLAARLQNLADRHGLKADRQCTMDSARLLRPVGALHGNGRRVTAKRFHGEYTLAELEAALDQALSGKKLTIHMSEVDKTQGKSCQSLDRRDISGDIITPLDGGVIRCGERNGTLFRLAAGYRALGHSEAEILDLLREDNKRCEAPVADDELAVITGSAMKYEPNTAATPPEEGEQLPPGFPNLAALPGKFSVRWGADGEPLLCGFMNADDEDGKKVLTSFVRGGLFYLTQWCLPTCGTVAKADEDIEAYAEFRFRSQKTRWQTGIIPAGLLADPGALAKHLAKHNIHLITSGARNSALLRRYVMTLLDAVRKRADSIPARVSFGFQILPEGGMAFVHGGFAATAGGFRRAVPGKHLRSLVEGFSVPCLRGIEPDEFGVYADADVIPCLTDAARGVAHGFAEAYPLAAHAPYRFAAAMTVAAPLMVFFGEFLPDEQPDVLPSTGFGLNLYSQDSGRGKSVLQMLCAYAMAHPSALAISGAIAGGGSGTSPTAVMSTLKALASYPLICDEITNSDPEALSAVFYSLSLGREKRRATQVGGLLDSGRWATMALSSSNVSIRDLMSSVRSTGSAEQLRFLEINLDTADGAALGSDLSVIQGIVRRRFAPNRGAIPLLLANYVVRNPASVSAAAVQLQTTVADKLGLHTKERFYARALAAALLAQRILDTYGVSLFSDADIVAGFKKALKDSREHIDTSVLVGAELFRECLRALDGSIIRTDTLGDMRAGLGAMVYNPNVRRPLAGRFVAATNTLVLSRGAVKRWCSESRVSFKHWLDAATQCTTPLPTLAESEGKFNLTVGIPGEAPIQLRALTYRLRDEDASLLPEGHVAEVVPMERRVEQ